jgi:hypothetical protein
LAGRCGLIPAGGGRPTIKLLVANRGEIAVRIMATASVPGIETVAVYAADDVACGHVGHWPRSGCPRSRATGIWARRYREINHWSAAWPATGSVSSRSC